MVHVSADENTTDKRNELHFLFREMFSLILSCLICSEASSMQEKLLQTQ